ncbi:MAG: hypothetical protein A4E48_01400 [Methanosaeta sp. PtaU1.Bin060]|jgi:hypothetical protein|nr:MAG: hypothetical protein A4E48_01400 [Methanosaeta sp. PtaU1.Bin060]
MTEGKRVLLAMGCPEVPVQTGIVLYLAHRLGRAGCDVTVAGTDAALKLLRISDPEGYYIKKVCALDQCIADLVEMRTDFDAIFVFMHNDAGMTYGATFSAISKAKLYAVIFGKNAEALAETVEYPAEMIVAKAVHNPMPLKSKLDRVMP